MYNLYKKEMKFKSGIKTTEESNSVPLQGQGVSSPLGARGSLKLTINIRHAMLTSEGKKTLEVCAEVETQELMCLFGNSGAGKTTLLRIIAGLTKPDSGRIVFKDEVWFDSSANINLSPQKRNIGFMFQDYALFPNMSVEKNISFAQREKNTDEVEKLISLFDLQSLKAQKPAKLSGGQKQRVALARAMAAKPNLLLLDEPLSALDWEMRSDLQDEIIKIHLLLNSITIFVSHDIQEVHKLASSVLILKNGEVIKRGKPTDIFEVQVRENCFHFPTF